MIWADPFRPSQTLLEPLIVFQSTIEEEEEEEDEEGDEEEEEEEKMIT